MTESPWRLSDRADPAALLLADRHYNRQKPGTPQFVPPGRCLVLLTADRSALWVTSWPFAEYVKHAWAGAWVNSLFRREGGGGAAVGGRGGGAVRSVLLGYLRAAHCLVLADELGHVVVRIGVVDRPGDGRRLFAAPPGLNDLGLQGVGCPPVRVGRSLKALAGRLIHTRQCRMFQNYGHEPILRDEFLKCYRELSS